MTALTQTRGHCQMCGRQQAVRSGISAHGYTVANGWFQGVCHGHRYAPLETQRTETDSMIVEILAGAAALHIKAAEMLAGKIDPVEYDTGRRRNVNGKFVPVMELFAEAGSYRQQDIRSRLSWNMTKRAEAGEDFAKYMGALADKVHGTALAVVAKAVPAERVRAGDKRLNSNGTLLTAKYQDGHRVYYSITRDDGKVMTSWISPRSWRALQAAVEAELEAA